MAISPFSQIVKPAEFQNPMDLNLYAQGTQYKEGLAKQNLQDISQLHNSIFNIPTYGKDKEKLMELEQGLRQQMSQMNFSNLGNMETASQIRNLIGQAANNPEVQGIAQRYGTYANELKKKEDAEAKGKSYISPIIDQAEEYYGSGVYKNETRFNQSGWEDPQLEKRKLEILKDIPKVTTNKKVGNYWVPVTSPDMDALKMAYQGLYNDPNVRKSQEYNFNKTYKNVDWATQGQQELLDGINKANIALSINPNDEKAQAYVQKYSSLLQNPQKLGEFVKNRTMQETIEKQIQDDIAAANYVSEGKLDADDFTLKAIDHQNRMSEDLYKLQLKTGLTREQGESQSAYTQRLAEAAQNKELEIAQAKSDITQNRQESLEKLRQEGKMGILEYKTKNGLISIKDNGEKKITIGGEEQDKATLKGDIERENTARIQQVLNEFAPVFGLTDFGAKEVDPNSVKVVDKGGVKWVQYQDDDYGIDDDFEVPLSDVIKYISDPNHIPTVKKNNKILTGSEDLVDKSNVSTPSYVTPTGVEVVTEGYSEEQIQEALRKGIIKAK